MKNILFTFAIVIFTAISISAQDCFKYFLEEEGLALERKTFDKKNTLVMTTVETLVKKTKKENNIQLDFVRENFMPEIDATAFSNFAVVPEFDSVITSNFSVTYDNEKVLMDLTTDYNEFLASFTQNGMDVEIIADKIEFPANPQVKDKLKDCNVTFNLRQEGKIAMTMNMDTKKRKVEGFEEITTEAGTYNCLKISSIVILNMGFFKVKSKKIEWYSDGVGIVRTEEYDEKDKLSSYTVLTSIKAN